MTLNVTSATFPAQSRAAVSDQALQQALGRLHGGFVLGRAKAVGQLPEFDALRDRARDIKDHVIEHLDVYLEAFEAKVIETGGQVHWASDIDEARDIILAICQAADAKTVTKGKSMIGEEIEINAHLERHGIRPVETDLGEYIIQLRHELPSHIIAPATHVSKQQVSDSFRDNHGDYGFDPNRPLEEAEDLLAEARTVLRREFLAADVGITGANLLIAETGTSVIVTNEGNGDLTQILPKVHIVLASLEKIVPTLEDATTILRVLARSATGQEMSSYTTFSTGPKRAADADGPEHYHVVLLDNGRTDMLAGGFKEMLRCIRCGACLNHCPVYGAIGGHAYGSVYPGPMGAVLSPALAGLEQTSHLPQASTLCGKCEEVCPVRIPLPKLLRQWRDQAHQQHLTGLKTRWGIAIWAYLAKRPRLYHFVTAMKIRELALFGGKSNKFKYVPGLSGWTRTRDFPAPEGKTFMSAWKKRRS